MYVDYRSLHQPMEAPPKPRNSGLEFDQYRSCWVRRGAVGLAGRIAHSHMEAGTEVFLKGLGGEENGQDVDVLKLLWDMHKVVLALYQHQDYLLDIIDRRSRHRQ